MITNTAAVPSQLPDDLNPEIVKATAVFIGKITGLVPPPHDTFPPEWHGHLRTFTSRLNEIARENAATVAPAREVQAAQTTLPQPVLDALRFYAHGHHFSIDDSQ